jgi:hypothetical protein
MSYDTIKSRNNHSARAWAGQFEKHNCAVPGCGEVILRRLLMCPVHWRLVPRPTQIALSKAFRSGDRKTYLAERQAAIDSVTGGQLP